MRLLTFIGFSLCLTSNLAQADQAWMCSWRENGPNDKLIIDRFRIDKNYLIDENRSRRLIIVENTEFSIVAAWADTYKKPKLPLLSIDSELFMLNKTLLSLKVVEASVTGPRNVIIDGGCVNL